MVYQSRDSNTMNMMSRLRWRSGRASDSESRGSVFDPHRLRRVTSFILIFIFFLHFFFDEIHLSKQIVPHGTQRSAASHLGLCCLPKSHEKVARLT